MYTPRNHQSVEDIINRDAVLDTYNEITMTLNEIFGSNQLLKNFVGKH